MIKAPSRYGVMAIYYGYGPYGTYFGRMHARQDVQSSQILIYILSSGLDMTEAPSFFLSSHERAPTSSQT